MDSDPSCSPCTVRLARIDELREGGALEHLLAHWHESGKHKDEVPLAVDWEQFYNLERVGNYVAVGAWRDGKVIGYAGYFIGPSLHHRNTAHALNIAIYVAPEHRGIAPRIVRCMERAMREAAQPHKARIIYEAPIGSEWAQVLEALDYERMGSIHGKVIEP